MYEQLLADHPPAAFRGAGDGLLRRARPVRTVGRRGVVAARRLRVVVVDKTAAAGEAVSVARVLVRAHHQQREQGQGNYSFARSARACRRELSGNLVESDQPAWTTLRIFARLS